jgi:DNA-directed RNA polymerase specialized sigma24 family protein
MPQKEAHPKGPTPRKRHRLKVKIVPLTHDLDQQGTFAESPEDRHIRLEGYQNLHHAIAQYPPPDRELLYLRYGFEGPPRTLTELALARKCTPEAVRQKIDRLLKGLRAYLKRRELRENRKIQAALQLKQRKEER